MIAVHLDGLKRADMSMAGGLPAVILRVGAFDRVTLLIKSEAQARIIAEAINAGLKNIPHEFLDRQPEAPDGCQGSDRAISHAA